MSRSSVALAQEKETFSPEIPSGLVRPFVVIRSTDKGEADAPETPPTNKQAPNRNVGNEKSAATNRGKQLMKS
ncbi:hypothetical protein llg_30980 [Luteolibacter sp. LG18]|nr:hypothetical protein llg_30980 [Luteolibacter sp. LG18]